MAKNFHYFKFIATEWLTGDIVFEDFELQGIFINVCALYWHRDGKISVEDVIKRLKNERFYELTDRFVSVKDGFLSIKFLDEQLIEANHISKTNSDNGKKGGRPKKETEIKPTALRPLSEVEAKKSKIEIELKENTIKGELEVNNFSITVGNRVFTGKTSEWLNLNKEQAIETLMMKYPKLKLQDVNEEVDSQTNQYHFKDDNHPYNFFKSVCEKLVKLPTKQTPKIKAPEDFWSRSEYESYCKQNNLESKWD